MNVIKLRPAERTETIDEVKRKADAGIYVELFIVAVCADGKIRQIEIKQPWIDLLETAG